jgi:hypothetical protein
VVDEAASDGESSIVGASHRCLAPLEIGTGLSIGFGTADEPRFVCPLIKALAMGAHCPLMRGMLPTRRSVRGRGGLGLGLTGLGLRST